MTSFPDSPRVLKGGIVLVDPVTGQVLPNGMIVLQYNPDTLSRTLKIKGMEEGGDRSEALRLKGPPVETFKLDAEIDATDQLEFPDQNPNTVQIRHRSRNSRRSRPSSIRPARTLQNNFNLVQQGTLEIVPMETPLTLFVWSANRIVPVRMTDFSVTEEAFDPTLNPIRAKVSLGMRVLVHRRSLFHRQGRQPLHGLSAAEGSPGATQSIRDFQRARDQGDSMSDPLQVQRAPDAGVTADRAQEHAVPAEQPLRRDRHRHPVATARQDHRLSAAPLPAFCRKLCNCCRSTPSPKGERLDNIAAQYMGDPTLFWRLCDANNAMRPEELTETIGRILRITLPQGIPGAPNA